MVNSNIDFTLVIVTTLLFLVQTELSVVMVLPLGHPVSLGKLKYWLNSNSSVVKLGVSFGNDILIVIDWTEPINWPVWTRLNGWIFSGVTALIFDLKYSVLKLLRSVPFELS